MANGDYTPDGACGVDAANAVAVADRMAKKNPRAKPLEYLPEVHPSRIPRHIAIIMDGNGRWAKARGFPRIFGHYNGARSVREVLTACGDLGVEVVTLYSFSLENWKRPAEEVAGLMDLCVRYLTGEIEEFVRNGIRVRILGTREGLPAEVQEAMRLVESATAGCEAFTLCLAINYGSRAEIASAARSIAESVARGEIDPQAVDESVMERHLFTSGLPDPDLLIRTAGERRISNYMLWQLSYSELYFSDVLWPDFGRGELFAAVRDFAARSRRFGGLEEKTPHA
jgi:undecaprenyl diphosphate synthase